MSNSPDFILEHFKLPPRYRDINWDMLTDLTKKDKAISKNYIKKYNSTEKDVKESIYLCGEISGSGKTSLAICLAKDLIKSGKLKTKVLFIPFVVLMANMRQDKGTFEDSKIFRNIIESDFVIFDDVGVERLNSSIAERYYVLLEYLWLKKKHFIITSKFSINDLLNRSAENTDDEILDSIGSRLVGMCVEHRLENKKDYRIENGN
jgi:DNA replication protein DnaC